MDIIDGQNDDEMCVDAINDAIAYIVRLRHNVARERKHVLRERFAALAHKQWSGWLAYMFSKGTFNEDGTWTMPTWAVKRWKRQMNTPYFELSESEQDSDRKEADKFLAVIEANATG